MRQGFKEEMTAGAWRGVDGREELMNLRLYDLMGADHKRC